MALGCFVLGASAKPITPSEALERLGGSPLKAVAVKGKSSPKLVHTSKTKTGNPAVYIFNKGENTGYLVLSADDLAYPVLGYSDSGAFDTGNIPPQMEWWLSEYARQIEYASDKEQSPLSASIVRATRAGRETIAPQIKTKWDQGEPYNGMCPKIGAVRGYTGCVATAMAQVMNYWQYPEVGQGQITYTSESLDKKLSLNFGNTRFDWANMSDTYLPKQYTQAEADAVAYLMKAAGYAVKMDYAADSSGALAMNISNGLVKYFNYDPNIDYQLRAYYSASEWEQKIYDNLKNVGPILYGGGSMLGGGHSFICDGYDGNGLFHFNWGWSGMSDGYFSLDALAPTALGAGGGGGGGYNFTQDAVFGIQPPTGKPAEVRPLTLTQMGSLAAEITEAKDSLKFEIFGEDGAMWVNYNPSTLKLKFGAILEPQGDTPGGTIYRQISPSNPSIRPGYGTNPEMLKAGIPLPDDGLSDGTYKLTIATCPSDSETEVWTPVKSIYGYFNYVILTKKGSEYTVESNPIEILDLIKCEITNKLYFGGMARVRISVENNSDLELTKGFAPALFYYYEDEGQKKGALFFLGESIFLTVPPHSKVERAWDTDMTPMQNISGLQQAVELDLGIFDEATYNFYTSQEGNPVTMYPNPGVPDVSLMGSAQITNAKPSNEELPNGNTATVYKVSDPSNIDIRAYLKLNKGIFCYNCLACIVKPSFTESGEQVEILTMSGVPAFMETEGLRQLITTSLSYPTAEPGEYYAVMMAYQYGSNIVGVASYPTFFRLDTSDVKELPSGESAEEDGEIYNLQGISLGKDFDSLPAGLYIRNGKKVMKK